MPTVRPATTLDAVELYQKLRKADLMECWALGISAFDALYQGVTKGTETYSVMADDGQLVAMFGVNHFDGQDPLEAAVWMLGSDDLKSLRTALMRDTPKYLSRFHQKFPLLWNIVDARNTVHINWLKRLGFVGLQVHHLGPQKLPFIEFVRIDPTCVPLQQPA